MTEQKSSSVALQTRSKSVNGDDRTDSWDSMEGLSERPRFASERTVERTSLGALFAGMYHELSNPLANIRLAGEVLLEELEDSQNEGSLDLEYVKYKLSGIVREVDRAGSLIRELSQISRVRDFDVEWVNLKGLLERASASMQPRIPLCVRVNVKTAGDIHVRCDEPMLMTAFMNLISDAVATVGDRGEVSLEARMDSDNTVEITVTNTADSVLEQRLDRIFEPFFSTRKAGRGKGLGLFVPSEIVKSLQGKIWAETISGRGTAIKLQLTAKRIDPAIIESHVPGEP